MIIDRSFVWEDSFVSTIDRAVETLSKAVHKLASGAGRIKERLKEAAPYIAEAAVAYSAMPTDLRAEYDSICSLLAGIDQTPEEEACELAGRILILADNISRR